MATNRIIGIDLGSSNSAVSIEEGGEIKTIPNAEGSNTTPSIVAFTKDGIKVGEPAKRQANTNAESTIYNIKRLMGKTYDQVKHLKRPYKIVSTEKGGAAVEVEGRIYTPEQISAMILQKLKKTAEDYLGEEVTRAVITVPAFFNSEERDATKAAGQIAGLTVERVISEPTSACLNIKDTSVDRNLLVVDAGGSTVDISIVNVADGVYNVVSTHGDVDLGGFLIDEALVNYVAEEFLKEKGVDIRKDNMAFQRLIEACEKAKIELSASAQTDINLPYITVIDNVPAHLVINITRAKFESLIEFFNTRILNLCKECLGKEKIEKDTIDDVVLVGGSCRIPSLQSGLESYFGKKPNKSLNLDLCVAEGAAIQGSILTGSNKDIILLDVLPISLGIETAGGVFTKMIEGNTTIPTVKSEIYTTATDNQTSVEINVLQGERSRASENKSLGKFTLTGIPPGSRGVPQIEVSFNVDTNSILTVTAKEKNTGIQQSIKISNTTSLTEDEIQRFRAEAEANAEADRKFKEETEKLNQAESVIFSAEKQLKDFGDKVTPQTKANVTNLIKDLNEAKTAKDLDKIESVTKSLNEELSKFYNEIQQNSTKSESTTSEQKKEEPVDSTEDVDYTEVK